MAHYLDDEEVEAWRERQGDLAAERFAPDPADVLAEIEDRARREGPDQEPPGGCGCSCHN